MTDDRSLEAHAVRPTDLVALVTFDGEVFANQAVTREHLVRPKQAPHPIGAAIEQWLGLGRQTWVEVRGRQIEGIATARELAEGVWQIDALVDASAPSSGIGEEVLTTLLRKAVDAAREHRVTHVLLRTPLEGPAHVAAMHAGFGRVNVERTYRGRLETVADGDAEVRPAAEADDLGRFQLFNRTLPLEARQAVAATLEEWRRTRERRWLGRGSSEWVALHEGGVVGALALSPGEPSQLEVEIEVDGQSAASVGGALLNVAAQSLEGRDAERGALAVVGAMSPATSLLEARGFELDAEYVLLCHRTTRQAVERRRVPAGMAVPTSG
ncbi:MAG: hypothetical protein R3C39_04510 [Dehalococcoidia bacterium]